MAKLLITRSNEWMNRGRGIGIYVNDKKVGDIVNGETRDITLPEGNYVLKAKIDWCGSNNYSFNISENETPKVVLSSFGYSWYFFPISGVLIAIHLLLYFVYKINYLIWVPFAFIMILLYYFSIGRNKYLVLKEAQLAIG